MEGYVRFFSTILAILIIFSGLLLLFLAFSYRGLTSNVSVGHSTKITENNVRLASFGQTFKSILESFQIPKAQVLAITEGTEIPILMYHYVRDVNPANDPIGYNLSVSKDQFEYQMLAFLRSGYNFVTPSQFLKGEINNQSIMLTFDDGYRDFFENAFPILKKHRIKATVFVVSDFMENPGDEYMTIEQIIEIQKFGIEIGSHSVNHPNLTSLNQKDLDHQLRTSKKIIEDLINHEVISFAYPSGQYNDQVVFATQSAGYQFAVTTDHGWGSLRTNLLAQNRIRISGGDTLDQVFKKIGK